MKIGLTLTTHYSDKIRPNGHLLLNEFLNSFRESNFKYDYKIYLVDNGSEYEYNLPKDLEIEYYKIEDQKTGGLTTAWNKSFDMAYKDGCDFIWNFNDDLVLNESINNFVEDSLNYQNNAIFGPLTDNGGYETTNSAPSSSSGYEVLPVRKGSWNNLPNGFSFGFTRETYELGRHREDKFFPIDHKMNNGDGKWGGQEGYFSLLIDKKIQCVLVKSCWIEHKKLRTWLKAKNKL